MFATALAALVAVVSTAAPAYGQTADPGTPTTSTSPAPTTSTTPTTQPAPDTTATSSPSGPTPTAPTVDPSTRAIGIVPPESGPQRGEEPGGPQVVPSTVSAQATGATGEFTPLDPTRILDTRTGIGGPFGFVGQQQSISFPVTGVAGIPSTPNVSAVVLNVTVDQPSAESFLTVWPSGSAKPTVSNLNFVPGQTVPNLVTVAPGGDGRVAVYNHVGATHVVADVVGFYSTTNGPAGSRYHSIVPAREFDTRDGTGGIGAIPMSPGEVRSFQVFGKNGVPNGAKAITLNLTVTNPTAPSFLTVYPAGPRPTASNLNFVPNQTVANLVVVRVPANGSVSFYNLTGFTHMVADVVGWYDNDTSTETGRFIPVSPTRLFDTRASGPLGPADSRPFAIAGIGPVPRAGVGAVVMNLTAAVPTDPGYLKTYPNGVTAPTASTLNFLAGQTVPNLAAARLGTRGDIRVDNFQGWVHAIGDVSGYFTEVTYGFDTCETPSISAMSTWRATSPYTSVGIYIGGVNRACANLALNNANWVNQVTGMGWRLIPVYVGLQAPCTDYLRRINPSSPFGGAYGEGFDAAHDAANRAGTAGLPPGGPIYLDMEYYNPAITSCSTAVREFVKGWVTGLHARGYLAGFYSSLAGGITDMVGAVNAGYPALDALWIASWNDKPNIYGFWPYLPDDYWANHQRLHQFTGGHNETYGGVTLNIDANAIDGPLGP